MDNTSATPEIVSPAVPDPTIPPAPAAKAKKTRIREPKITDHGPPGPEWRRRRLRELVRNLRQGLPDARLWFDDHLKRYPELIDEAGSIANRLEAAWTKLLVRSDPVAEVATCREIGELRAALANPAATPFDKLLFDHVVVCWLAEREAAQAEADGMAEVPGAAHRLARLNAAQKRFFKAVNFYETVLAKRPPLPSSAIPVQ